MLRLRAKKLSNFKGTSLKKMNQKKLNRLNALFEKALTKQASIIEKRELSGLYSEFINDGRENNLSLEEKDTLKQVAL